MVVNSQGVNMRSNIFFTIIFLFLLALIGSVPLASAKQIALSFDDAPMRGSYLYSGTERSQKIIEVLDKHQIQTVFFANSERLSVEKGSQRLMAYSKAGHFIANHTHSHPDLNSSDAKTYIADINKAHTELKSFPTFQRWFRFPYLREGEELSKRDEVRGFLKAQDYINGYVTVDNYDYYVNKLVMDALAQQRQVNLGKACEMLTDIMIEGAEYYDKVAREHIGDVRHVLLMHENDIGAHCLDRLIVGLKSSNWEIISPKFAYQDPLLQVEPQTLYLGQGRVAAIAHERTEIKYVSQWENTLRLDEEFKRRKITEE